MRKKIFPDDVRTYRVWYLWCWAVFPRKAVTDFWCRKKWRKKVFHIEILHLCFESCLLLLQCTRFFVSFLCWLSPAAHQLHTFWVCQSFSCGRAFSLHVGTLLLNRAHVHILCYLNFGTVLWYWSCYPQEIVAQKTIKFCKLINRRLFKWLNVTYFTLGLRGRYGKWTMSTKHEKNNSTTLISSRGMPSETSSILRYASIWCAIENRKNTVN